MEAQVKLFYKETLEIWKNLCELHNLLLKLTNEEYTVLLESNFDALNLILNKKENILKKISNEENRRITLIKNINSSFQLDINKAKELILFFDTPSVKVDSSLLLDLNNLLIDIIENNQRQNKRNQIFLNKAMSSLSEFTSGLKGLKKFETYDHNGNSQIK